MTTQETPQDRFNVARSKFLNGMVDASSSKIGEPIDAHLSAHQEGQEERFKMPKEY
ncbi:MAG: hypothetical protein PG981_000613 [Wolbachia endosymbiont of Ctenocephalides orientis wCori]|nr:MAG: hypothetical protein PG981_000613 [Wolbachia endosymbiont of Ctenocephalides orientis wCori]